MSKFSLVCTTYKSELFLRNFLDNVNAFENAKDLTLILVMNDQNETERQILDNVKGITFHLEIIEVERESIAKSTNRGFKLCDTEFMGYLDVDDLHPTNSYKLMLNTLENCEVTYGDYIITQEKYKNLNKFTKNIFSKQLAKTKPIFGPTHFFRKSVLNRAGYWDEQLLSAGDFDWQIRASAVAKVKKTTSICTYYNFSPVSASRSLANSIENLVIALRYHNLSEIGSHIECLAEALKYDIQYCHFNNTKNSVSKFLNKNEQLMNSENELHLIQSFGVKRLLSYLPPNILKRLKLLINL